MKKTIIALLCMMLAGLCACELTLPSKETTTAQAATTEAHSTSKKPTDEIAPEELAPYAKILKRYYNRLDARNNYFYALYDLDGNGTKELLLGEKLHPSQGEGVGLLYLFTIRDKKAVDLRISSESPPLLFEDGLIKIESRQDIGYIFRYYRFEDGELKLQKLLSGDSEDYKGWLAAVEAGVDPNVLPPPYYYIDANNPDEKVSITEEKFEQMQKDMEGNEQVVEIAWRPLADYEGGPWWLFW